jgi:sulfite exporter TauE/SafE
MSLLITMLPFYLTGNLHCMGMCGPLVFMLAQHRFRYLYFLGRTLSFSFCGLAAGAGGSILNIFLNEYHLAAVASLLFGGILILIGSCSLLGAKIGQIKAISKLMNRFNRPLSVLMLRDQPWPTFLFGFFTVALPCGQTLVVFSACALYGDAWVGFINGLCFALLTSPSLIGAMHASFWLQRLKPHYHLITAICAIGIGGIAICRGLAEISLIPHLVLSAKYHIVIY